MPTASRLSSSVCHPVRAWLIASRKLRKPQVYILLFQSDVGGKERFDHVVKLIDLLPLDHMQVVDLLHVPDPVVDREDDRPLLMLLKV